MAPVNNFVSIATKNVSIPSSTMKLTLHARWRSARAEKASGRTTRLCVRASDGNPFSLVPFNPQNGAAGSKKKNGVERMEPGTGMEIVLHAARSEGDLPTPSSSEEPFVPLSKRSPRRTQRLRFTCNKCGEKTIRNVNPQALKSGTVFVQCGGCLVHHKLVDNLNIFDDMLGPQYLNGTTFHSRSGENGEPDWEYISRMRGFSVWDGLQKDNNTNER